MRRTPPAGTVSKALIATLALALAPPAGAQTRGEERRPRAETAEMVDGSRVSGRLVGSPSGVEFRAEGAPGPIAWDRIRRVEVRGEGPEAAVGPAPFRVLLGSGGRLSGRFVKLDSSAARLDAGDPRGVWAIARGGVSAVEQRPGEVQVFREGFDALDLDRWQTTGEPDVKAEPRLVGEKALHLPAGGASVTARLPTPLPSGRLELAFRDDGRTIAGQRWFVDLSFRDKDADLATLRVIPGWSDETSAVETPGGPGLEVQPLARKEGWHRLAIRFDAERTAVDIDGDDLAHGRGFRGPLQEIRIATESAGAAQPPEGLAAVVDDLRLARLVEPSGRFEVEPDRDEVRLVTGDQIFGTLESADADAISLGLDGRSTRWPWAEVSALYPRRTPASSAMIGGLWVEAEWRTTSGDDPRDLDRAEAVLSGIDDASVRLDVPYAGRIDVPRDRLTRLEVQGRGARVVIDAHAHHLGDRVAPDLDPPRAESAPVDIPFTLGEVPRDPAALLIDAVKVIGEEGTPDYSALVKQGQLRTTATINDERIDDLNGHVTSRNDAPERLRLAVPEGVLRAGKNRLRLDQIGAKDDPGMRDNLGILRIQVEFAAPERAGANGP